LPDPRTLARRQVQSDRSDIIVRVKPLVAAAPTDPRSDRRLFAAASLILLAALFGASVYRASTQSITAAEALWVQRLTDMNSEGTAPEPPSDLVFESLLAKGSIHVFGLSELALRLPSVLGGLLYFFAIFRLCRLLFGHSAWLPLAIALTALNPLTLDYCAGLPGCSFGLAFWMLGVHSIARWVSDREAIPITAGVALGLAVVFAPASIFAVAALETVFVALALADRLMAKDVRGAARFAGRDALAFCLATFAVVAGIAWRLPLHGGLPSADAVMIRYIDGLKSLVNATLLYRPVFPTSWAVLHGLLEGIGGLLPLAVLAGCTVAAWQAGRRWLRARRIAAVDRTGRFLLLLTPAAILTLVLLWAEPRLAHHRYYGHREFLFALLPVFIAGLLPLRRFMAGGTSRRAFAAAGISVFCLLSLQFALQFNLYSYYRRESDANVRTIVNLIRQRHSGEAGQYVTLFAGFSRASLDFYLRLYEIDWLHQASGDMDCAVSYYYVSDVVFDRLAGPFCLREIHRDHMTRAVLAETAIEAKRQLAVARSLGFSAPEHCDAGIFANDGWAEGQDALSLGHFVRDIQKGLDPVRWRWTFEKPAFLFYIPARTGVKFKMDFVLHSQTFRQTGPVRMTVRINGKELGRRVYDSPENQTFEQAVPPEMLRADGVALVETVLDKYYVAPADGQKLGYLFVRGGFIY
jgi:hypothetical protein